MRHSRYTLTSLVPCRVVSTPRHSCVMLLFTIAHIAPFLHPCIGSYLLFYPPIIKRNPIHSDDCRYPQRGTAASSVCGPRESERARGSTTWQWRSFACRRCSLRTTPTRARLSLSLVVIASFARGGIGEPLHSVVLFLRVAIVKVEQWLRVARSLSFENKGCEPCSRASTR